MESKEIDELIDWVKILPDSIAEQEKKIIALNLKMKARDNKLKEIEGRHYAEIKKDEDLSNEKLREVEVAKRIKEDVEYQVLKDEQQNDLMRTQETRADADRDKDTMKMISIVTELMKIKWRM